MEIKKGNKDRLNVTISQEASQKKDELLKSGVVISWLVERAILEQWDEEIGHYIKTETKGEKK